MSLTEAIIAFRSLDEGIKKLARREAGMGTWTTTDDKGAKVTKSTGGTHTSAKAHYKAASSRSRRDRIPVDKEGIARSVQAKRKLTRDRVAAVKAKNAALEKGKVDTDHPKMQKLIDKLRADPKVRDPEKLAGWIARRAAASKGGES